MFYPVHIPEPKTGEKMAHALVVLNPSESRRLVAKATVALPEVQNAMKKGLIIIGRGVTNAYVTEELLKTTIEPKAAQTVGLIANGFANAHTGAPPCTWHVIRRGKVVEGADSNVEIQAFGPDDVFLKGGNAIDPQGHAGIWASGMKGGTIGMCWPVVTPRGAHLIQPIGLEKMIPSVEEAAKHSGIYHYKYSIGIPGKIVPVTTSLVVTEIEAFAILAGVRAYQIAAGGVGGSEGAVALTLEGEAKKIEKAFNLAKSVKGEPPVTMPTKFALSAPADCRYDAMKQHATLGGM